MTDAGARNRRNRRKGAEFETALMNGFREHGSDIERLRLAGVEDEGDLVIRYSPTRYLVIEAKNAKFEPSVFIKEVEQERTNFAKHRNLDPHLVGGIAIVKRRGKSWRQSYVLTTVEEYFGLEPE
ncbi:hypothetical protein [Actinocorallia libanotica]|uniref:Holliday junction resolvase n=1 Tax=Actinocorallia libanotica TaxID=46162 RepID=A0ABN1RY81_9ACTN